MAAAKAPRWLTQTFQQGVDYYATIPLNPRPAYPGAHPYCWLAAHDPARRPCTPGHLERFHFIRRQDVEGAMWAQLLEATVEQTCELCRGSGCNPNNVLAACLGCDGARTWPRPILYEEKRDLILIAAWDPRNGGLACEQHHRRYDNHQVSLPRERVIVRYEALPSRVIQFGFDYSEGRLLDRFPSEI